MAALGVRALEVGLFGSLRLRYGGEPLALAAPPKVTPLFAALLLAGSDPVARDRLASRLWPDEPSSTARANLRRHLHYLARALPDAGEPWFHADARSIRPNPALPIEVDVRRFEAHVAEGRRAAAVALYEGDLLAAIDEEWLEPERVRLRALHLENLAALVAAESSARRHASAAQYARRLLDADPWREDALRAHMIARFELGDRAAALAAYDAFEDALRVEIGTDPMPETRALRARIAAEEPIVVASPPPRAAALAAVAPFVGRQTELGRLETLRRGASSGRGATVFVVGEAGIGKSRLLAAFRSTVEREGGAFALGGTSAPESGPYEAVLEAIAALAPRIAASEIDELRLRTLAAVLPSLAALRPGLEPPPALEPERLRERLFDAIAGALRAVARAAPLVVALEDLHWAGSATCALVASLAERLADAPVVFVATYRDEEVSDDHSLFALMRRVRPVAEHLALGPFTRDDVARFVCAATGIAELPDPLAARFEEHSDGNPFALGQILRDGLESDAIRIAGSTLAVDALVLPRAVEQILAARLERLTPAARAAAQIAAVLGRRFPRDVVARASGLGESRTAGALNELLDHQLVHEAGKGEFAFLHHTIVETIAMRSDADDLRRRHRRVAETLEALRASDIDQVVRDLAYHWESAGEPARAVPFELRAAELALALFAHEEARERVERALAHGDEPASVARALLLREELARRAGDRDAQQRDLAALVRNAAVDVDDELRCEVLRRRAALAHLVGDRAREEAAIAELRACATRIGSSRWETTALLLQATADIAAGRFDDASGALERARSLEGARDPAFAVEIGCNLALIAVHRAEYDRAESVLDEAWIAAGNDEALRYRVLDQRASLARARERFDRVHLIARDLLAYSQRIGDRRAEMSNHLRLANASLFVFGIAEAREHYAVADRMAQTLGSPRDRSSIALCRGIFAYALGIADEGSRCFEAARTIAAADGDAFCTVLADVNLATADYARGAFTDAVERARACIAPANALGAVEIEAAAYCTAGAALRRLGRAREALASLRQGVAMERAAGLRWTIGQDVAELTLAQLDAGEVDASLAAAVDELAALAETSFGGLTQPQFMLHVASRAARALGDVARADALFMEAQRVYRERLARIPDESTRASFAAAWFNEGLASVDLPRPASASRAR